MSDELTRSAGRILADEGEASTEPEEVRELVRRSKEGDREAFDELVGLFQNRVWGIAWRMTGRRDDALEASQEAFLRAWRYLGSFKEGMPFGPWISRITVHASQDQLHRSRGGPTMLPVEEERGEEVLQEPRGERRVLEQERRRVLFSLLDRLTERERSVFVLREVQGLPTKEVAEILGIRAVTVRRHAGRARSRLLEILKEEHPELLEP